MQIKQLEYIQEIARQGSIRQAADSLYISQQALSEMLKKLEDELGFPIFRRTNKGVIPTSSGEKVLRDIGEILHTVAGWEQYKEKQEADIMIQYLIGDLLLDHAFSELLYRLPNINPQIETAPPEDMVEKVMQDVPCFALFCLEENTKNYRILQRFSDSTKYCMEEVLGGDALRMMLLMKADGCVQQSNVEITMDDIAGRTLAAIKDLLLVEVMQKFQDEKRLTIRALPRSVKAVDLVAKEKNIITYMPHFVAERNIYVRNGTIVMRRLKESEKEKWHMCFLYQRQYECLFRDLIQKIRDFFAEEVIS